MTASAADAVSVYDRLVWPEGAIEALLASGDRRRELMAYLGEAEYRALQPLAVAASRTPRDGSRCVFLVPGIMGSQLSLPRAPPLPDNLLWLDPVDFQQGHLSMLALPGPPIRTSGPVLHSYLRLKLVLEASGYAVQYFDYDWRSDLTELGAELAARIEACAASEISIVGHSMGGIIGRLAMLRPVGARVHQLVTLGTPHGGSFAPLQALRGVYPLVRRIAQLDPLRSAEQLASEVFSTFPSLYQMLPSQFGGLDLFNAANWPSVGPQPNATLLARAARLEPGSADPRIVCIAGYGRDTVVDASLDEGSTHDNGFVYGVDPVGDGTVPVERAILPGTRAWFCEVGHSELPRHPLVHASLLALLSGHDPLLNFDAPRHEARQLQRYSDAQLRQSCTDKIDWSQLDAPARRQFLDSLNEATR